MALEGYAHLVKLMAQASFVNRLEQATAETAMHAHCQADDPMCEVTAVTGVLIHGNEPRFNQLDEALTGVWGRVRKQASKTQITQIKSQITQKESHCAARLRTAVLREAPYYSSLCNL